MRMNEDKVSRLGLQNMDLTQLDKYYQEKEKKNRQEMKLKLEQKKK